MNFFTNHNQQTIYMEANCFEQLPFLLEKLSFETLFLVTGQRSFQQAAIQNVIIPLQKKYLTIHFFEFSRNPQILDIKKGVNYIRHAKKPIIVAIGGGSVLDMAKLIRFFSAQLFSIEEFFSSNFSHIIKKDFPNLIAVPTTAGTGSEVTQFATLYINGIKHSVDTSSILPTIALIDANLTLELPAKETAESGMDALCQAIESYWNINATDASRLFAMKAIRILHENIKEVVCKPSLENRSLMMKGAYLAGCAINYTRTTAAHALSYPLTSRFSIAHGQAVSISIPWFFEYNYAVNDNDILDSRGVNAVKKTLDEIIYLLGYSSASEACLGLINLMKHIGLKTTLKELGIYPHHWNNIIQEGFNPERVKNNPRRLDKDQLYSLFKKIDGNN
ncbi:MAG: phosphonoacetaldehyde reductase [Pseudomonadota bacterium]